MKRKINITQGAFDTLRDILYTVYGCAVERELLNKSTYHEGKGVYYIDDQFLETMKNELDRIQPVMWSAIRKELI